MTSEISLQQAIHAWTRRQSGNWAEADEQELQAWLAAMPEHRAAYEKVARAWSQAAGLKRHLSDELRREYESALLQRGTPPTGFSAVARGAIAACLALLAIGVGIGVWPSASRWWRGSEINLVTSKGQTNTFTLADGTRVSLDADSQLTVQIGYHSRKASLVRGEALIDVAHDPKRPFEITLGVGRIQDLGTRFDIEALPGSSRVEVLEGRVGVSTPRGRALLEAGQSSGYDPSGTLQAVSSFDTNTVQWSQGQRHFDHESLGDALARLTRYHATRFVYTDSSLRDLRVSGTFRINDQALFLRTLAAALPIEVRYLGPGQVEIAARAATAGASSNAH